MYNLISIQIYAKENYAENTYIIPFNEFIALDKRFRYRNRLKLHNMNTWLGPSHLGRKTVGSYRSPKALLVLFSSFSVAGFPSLGNLQLQR